MLVKCPCFPPDISATSPPQNWCRRSSAASWAFAPGSHGLYHLPYGNIYKQMWTTHRGTLGKSPTNRGANDTSILVYMRGTIPVPYNFQPFLGLKDSDQFWNSCFVPTGSRNTFGASCWSLAEYPLGIFHVAGPPWFFPWFSQLQSSICFGDVPINRRLWEILVLLGFTVGKWSINAGCSIGSEFIHWSAVCPPWSWEIAMMLLFPNKGWNPSNIF